MSTETGIVAAGTDLHITLPDDPGGLPDLRTISRDMLVAAVKRWPDRKHEVAAGLGICVATLYARLDSYGLDTMGEEL